MSRRRNMLFGWSLALLAIAAFCTLGAWQWRRMHEKQAQLDAVGSVLAARRAGPLSLAADPARTRAFDWAAGTGHFAAAPPVLLDNQQREGRVGLRAYRVFVPDRGTPLLVELGWLPVPGDRRMPAIAMPIGSGVEGLLLAPPSGGIVAASQAPQGDGSVLATTLDMPALAAALGQPALAPRVLRLDPRDPRGYARDLDVLPNTLPPAKHLGYAVQWFALALAVLATALLLTFRKPRR